MSELFLDFETFSTVPINHGGYKYTANCEPMLLAFAFDEDAPDVIDFTDPDRDRYPEKEVLIATKSGNNILKAHNAMFDRNVMTHGMKIETPREWWRCTMVQAMAHSLPGKLGLLSEIFRLGVDGKDKEGAKLIQLFCKPQGKKSKIARATRLTHPEQWEAFKNYAKQDIPACRKLDRILPKWNMTETELHYWFLDQRRNDLGVHVDVELAEAALKAVDREQKRLKYETIMLTEGELMSTTQRNKTLEFILEQFGVSLPDLTMATIERRLNDPDLPNDVKELLRIRLMVSTSSTSKYKALLRAVNDDHRLRGTIQFDGAKRTGRDAGRTFQPQNLPSRGILMGKDVDDGIRALKLGVADKITDNVMLLTSSTIRGCLVAPEGKKLVVADLSNIEGRYLAWLAGEQWKLDAFRAYDTYLLDENGHLISDGKGGFQREGHDLYNLAYAKSFRIDPGAVNKAQRQIGKVQELALGYEGGVGAFMAFAMAYGIDLEELAELAFPTLPSDTVKDAKGFYDWLAKKKSNHFGLSERAFVVCDSFKRLWRDAHPMTFKLWKSLEENARLAIQNPGETFTYRDLTFRRDGAWLRIKMPSGRSLCYPSPQLDDKGAISYMGENQYTRQWTRIHTHGGKLAENITQAGARDVFKHGEALAVANGYEVVIPVHDELVTETPDTEDFTVDGLSRLMGTVPVWAKGLPLAAAGYESYRYKKEG
jgi:DNA polymerase